jgi:putative glycosyltransferase (TIGR04348 family)
MCGPAFGLARCNFERMKIGIVTPAPKGSRSGNRVTAVRWAKILRELGHRVSIAQEYHDEKYDLLIALHARRSHAAVARFRQKHPDVPIIVALTGTDLYRDLHSRQAQDSLKLANRIIVLHPGALRELDTAARPKAQVIYQSVEAPPALATHRRASNRSSNGFDVCVIGHLRPVKDPFRAALAARLLPQRSEIRITHIGGAMTGQMEQRARREMRINPRYRWLGELSRARTLRILAASRLSIISSRIEGGANILSESIVASVPVLASRIQGNTGILGARYPGLFQAGNARQLARLLTRAETNSKFLSELKSRVNKLKPLFDPAKEEAAWARLLKN